MAEVIGMTAEAINAITNALVETGEVQADGTIVLITRLGTRLPIGNIAVDPALAQIANLTPANLDMIQSRSGVWENRTMDQVLADLGSDIHTIEGLTPADNDFLQRKAGAWTNRTVAQVMGDLRTDPHLQQTLIHPSSVNRTATALVDDATLTTTLDPNSTYDVSADLAYSGAVALTFSWTVPSGAGGFQNISFNLAGTGEVTFTYVWPTAALNAGAVSSGIKIGGYITTAAAGGTFAFKWGSATSGQTVTLGTSIMRIRKVSP